jgi:hypothetical protein
MGITFPESPHVTVTAVSIINEIRELRENALADDAGSSVSRANAIYLAKMPKTGVKSRPFSIFG